MLPVTAKQYSDALNSAAMPWRLQRYQHAGHLHYVTFTCYHRAPRLSSPAARELFEHTLERVRRWYGFYVSGYVVMPEHVRLLLSEPERAELSVGLQMLKQIVSRKLGAGRKEPLWQRRYYDFNVFSQRKFVEKLCYMHRNPGAPGKPGSGLLGWKSVRRDSSSARKTGPGAASGITLRA